ncbi:uncharacterized protein LOC111868189 [Cryptotermes secundus]|uniref:uncharacterized protein LOC111868189 n=1 Tax=Cryptotermes secundus TaxID=105785 RepID=UPI000CD7D236|nr:uncharacterized protein LOC111868189 [Cryptotermes secundus]
MRESVSIPTIRRAYHTCLLLSVEELKSALVLGEQRYTEILNARATEIMLKSVSPQLSPKSNSEIRVVHLSVEQEQVLEAQFGRVKNPHSTDLVLLAAETGLQETDVQAWYAQRLAAWRKEQGLSTNFGTFN